MLYRGNALSDLLDNVFIVEAGKSAPGYLWRCLPLDLALHTSSLDLIDVLFCWFLKHIELQSVWAGDWTTVGGCCKSLSSGDYNYVTGINYITNIRTPSLPVTGQQGQQSWAIRFIEARVRERVERDCRNWINNIDTALGRERDPAIVMVLSKLSPDSRILCCKTLEILSNKIF